MRRIRVFFYGLFMDPALLREAVTAHPGSGGQMAAIAGISRMEGT